MKITDEDILKLHVDQQGLVWFADGDRVPVCSNANVNEFADTMRQRQPLYVRMLGTHLNALLLDRLYPWCSTHGGRIEVATPRLCYTASELLTPEMALTRIRQCRLPASLGGWHVVTEADYTTYALIAALSTAARFDDRAEYLLMKHPLWKHLQFIYEVQPEWAAWAISFIVDPRWHVDRQHPDRARRLCNFMGLSSRIHRRRHTILDRTGRHARYHAVLMTWRGGRTPTIDEVENDPRCFLDRICRLRRDDLGPLRASGKLLMFMRQTWLQSLTVGTRYSGGDSMFSPEMFFKTQSEVEAYKAHIESC